MKLIKEGTSFTITGFKRDASYNYQKLEKTDGDGQRLYQVGDNNVPSVTTILSKTQSEDKRKSLDQWRERVGYSTAQKITQIAATRGTEMHYVLENYIKGIGYLNLSDKGAEARLMAHEIIKGLPELTVIHGSEVSLSYENRWAGQTDLIATFDGKPTIVDFKQSNKPKREEWIEDYYYQIAAYALAHKKQYGDIKQGVIAMCTPNLVFQRFMVTEEKLLEYEDKWYARVEKYYKMQK